MRTPDRARPARAGGHHAALIMVAITLAACAAALVFRTPLRSRYWARQVIRASQPEERAAALTRLCNAGDAGRWGTAVLLTHPDEEIRQYGVLVLQHVRSDGSRRRLLRTLKDPSEVVREMAAFGLAIHGDVSVVPELKRLYGSGDAARAAGACLALERLSAPEAGVALVELAAEPSDPAARAALVDALEQKGTVACAAALLKLLDDHRPCDVPSREEGLLQRLTPIAREHGFIDIATSGPTSRPASKTVAERAAAALARITGLSPTFKSDLPDRQRQEAERIWRDWLVAQRAAP